MVNSMKKLMVIAPHCDDEVLLCGATINKLVKSGNWKIFVVPCSYNEQAWSGEYNYDGNRKKVWAQLLASSKILHFQIVGNNKMISWPISVPGEDMSLEPNGHNMKFLIERIREVQPDVVITCHPNCFHTDHRNVALAVREAAYQAARKGIMGSEKSFKEPVVLWGEVDMEGITEMKCMVTSEIREEDLEKKYEALKVYEGFVDNHPNQASIFTEEHGRDWVFSLARLRGMHSGVKYAEVFEIANFKPMVKIEVF